MTAAQTRAVEHLRRDIVRLDCTGRRTAAGVRIVKRWDVRILRDGRVRVDAVCGWPTHTFDDIRRTVIIGRRGGLSGVGSAGHDPRAGNTPRVRGPGILYAMDAHRVF